MFYIKMADLTIAIDNRYGHIVDLCKDYIVEETVIPHMTARATEEEIDKEISLTTDRKVSRAYAESICVYRNICKRLPREFGAFLVHSAVIEYEGEAYAFAAASGTGKSTHISLWKKHFGDGVRVINGDKPIMRFKGDKLFAYGTPWCGKERYGENSSAPLKAFCFLERAETNSIRRATSSEAVSRMLSQILTPETLEELDALFPLLDRALSETPCYILGCNISEEAAEVAYRGMNTNK